MPHLTITAADGRSFQRPLDKDVITIGRSSKNDLNLSFDLSLSRFHAEIVRDGGRYLVRDVGSRNGTNVNGSPIAEPVALKPGDRISIGETTILFGQDRQPEVVLDDTPLAGGTTTFSIPIDDIITRSAVSSGGVPGAALTRDPRTTLAGEVGEEGRTLAILMRAGMELVSHRPHEEILNTIMDLVFEAIRADRGFLMLIEGENRKMVAQAVRDTTRAAGGPISLSRGIANMVIQNRHSVLTQDAQRDERFRMHESVVLQGIRSAMCVPLWNNKEVIGLLYVDSVSSSTPFRPEDLKLLTLLGNIAAVKIENARLVEQSIEKERLENELQQATDIQRRLLPDGAPALEGYEICGRASACRAVGGDYFDYVQRPGGRLGIVIGDVSGKGMAAALLMSSVQAVFRTLSDVEPSPASLLRSLNRHLIRSANPNKFCSFFFGELDPASGALRYVNAGHNPPILLRTSDSVELLRAGGCVLGVFEDAEFEEGTADLNPGDLLALYSDGITESRNTSADEYGEERLTAALSRHRHEGAAGVEEAVFAELVKFAAGAPQYDDSTLLILRRLP